MARFVLIHGAWHGGWCWERVAPLLEARGHAVLAPDLPGMGADRTPWAEDVLGQWTDFVAALAEAQPEPVVLVGHSAGAAVASAVTERIPDRVALVAYLAGFIAADGGSIRDLMAKTPDAAAAFVPSPDGRSIGIDPARAVDLFYHLCPPDAVAGAVARLTRSPVQPAGVRLRLSPGNFGRVPHVYIETTQDRALRLDVQRQAQSGWSWQRVVTLPSDHSPFYSMPERLAAALVDLAGVRAERKDT